MASRVMPPLGVQDRVPRRTSRAPEPGSQVPVYGSSSVGEDMPSVINARKAWADLTLCPEASQLVAMEAGILTNCFFEIAIDGEIPKNPPTRGTDGALYKASQDAVRRRFGDEESQGVHIADLATVLSVTGDANLAGYQVDPNGMPTTRGREKWKFYASDVIRREADGRYKITLSPGVDVWLPATGVVLDRLWFEHARHELMAQSWVINAHGICIDLALFRMARRASGRSQILADLLLVPSEASPEDPTMQTAWGASPSGTADEFAEQVEEMLHDALLDAMKDAADGNQVVPPIMAVEADFIEHFKQLVISRKMDPEFRPTVEGLRKELADAANMPREALFGLGDTNRWNGRQVTEEEFRRYHGPKVKKMAVYATPIVLWKDLMARRVRREVYERFTLRINADNAIVRPDWSQVGRQLVEVEAVGPSGWRRLMGLDDSYAPTAAEKAIKDQRVVARQANRQGQEPANKGTGNGRQRDDTVNPDNTGEPGQINRVAGAATPAPNPLNATVERLAALERETWARLEEACEAAWDASMARAGSQFKNWAKSNRELNLEGESRLLPDKLGPERCLRISGPKFAVAAERDAAIFGPALAVLLVAWARIIDQTWERSDLDVDEAERARWREQSVAVLRDSLILALSARVFVGWVSPSAGELSVGRIPGPILRRALAVAGGAMGVEAGFEPDPQAAIGMLFGPLALAALGVSSPKWKWDYGPRSAREIPFIWHQELDNKTFARRDDPALVGGPFGLRFPGDHVGCERCLWLPDFG